MNLDLACFDIGVNRGTLTDDQSVGSFDRSLNVAINADRSRKNEFSAQRGSFIEEAFKIIRS